MATPLAFAAFGLIIVFGWIGRPLPIASASAADLASPADIGQLAPAAHASRPTLIDAAELHVCRSGCAYTTVQAAVDAANTGDAILVAQGIYTDVQTIDALTQTVYLSKSLTIRGGYTTTNWTASFPVTQPTILDAGGIARVLYITDGVTATVEGFTFTNGSATDGNGGTNISPDYGAAVYLAGGNSIIRGNWIHNNIAERRGGGIYVAKGNPTIQSNFIYSNVASAATGGGVHIADGDALVQSNSIFANTAGSGGGGVFVRMGNPILDGNSVHGNRTTAGNGDDGGGGIYVRQPATPIIRRNAVYSNTIPGVASGAGIHIETTEAGGNDGIVIEQNAIYGNGGGYRGGGIYVRAQDHVIQNNLVYSNTATQYGGGIAYWWNGDGVIAHNTLFGNSAGSSGGGIYRYSNALVITGNIVANSINYGVYGPITCNYCDVVGSTVDNYGGGALVGTGTLTQTPQFVNPGSSFKLQADSPAIDAGEANPTAFTDFDGFGRPFGPATDMGAYEYTAGPCLARIGSGQIYSDVQAAVDASSQTTDVVKVAGMCSDVFTSAEGTSQTVYLGKGLTLRGGYSATNWTAPVTQTVLNPQGVGRAVYITGSSAITVDGFFIQNGSAASGGGVYVAAPLSPTIQNIIFYSNEATYGGGLATAGGNPRIVNNTFVLNMATGSGGGLYLAAGSPSLRSNIIASNTHGGLAAAVGATPAPAYNDVWGNSGGDYVGLSAGTTDVSIDPRFVDAASANFRLRYDSPIIHAADPNTTVQTDFEGDSRQLPAGKPLFDIGADESPVFPAATFTPKNPPMQNGRAGETTVYTYTLTNFGTITDTYDLTHTAIFSGPSSLGWRVTYSTPVTLFPGQARQVFANVQIGDAFSDTLATVYLTATSRINSRVREVVSNTTLITARSAVTITPPLAANLDPGDFMTFTQALQNAGNITDTYVLNWSHQPHWPVFAVGVNVTQGQVFTLGPYVSATLQVTVNLQAKAPGGLEEIIAITATSTYSPAIKAIISDSFTVNYKPGARHVATNWDDTLNNCLVVSQPCKTIVSAVGQATFADEVRVAAGTYYEPEIALNKNVKLTGGYNGNYTVWDPQTHVSIIDAQQKGRVLYIFGNPTVKGLTLRNGKAAGSGGGVYIGLGNPILSQNTIVGNEASVNGGGIFAGLSAPTLLQNVITGNVAANQGGGIYYAGFSAPAFERNVIAFNSAQQGAGFANASGSPTFWNNLVYRNSASGYGGGALIATGSPRLWHNTFYSNTASTGGALYLGGGSPMVSNTIVVSNNAASAGGIYSQTSAALLEFNDVWGNVNGDYVGLSAGLNDQAVDPQFRDVAALDLRIRQSSPLRNTLSPSSVRNDHWGDPRPVPINGLADIGADEFLLAVVKMTPNRMSGGVPGQTLTYTHVVTNSGEYTDTIAVSALSSRGFPVAVIPPTLTLGVDLTGTISNTVFIPASAISGTIDTTIVTAASRNDFSVFATVGNTTTVGRLVSVSLEANAVGLASSGVTQTYVHVLTNVGNYTDTFSLQGKSSNNYTVTLSASNITLAGVSSTPVTVSIRIPSGLPTTTAKLDVTVITATSQLSSTIRDTVIDTTYINRTYGVLIRPDRSLAGRPGDQLTYLHTLTNTGNYTDTFDLTGVLTYTPATYGQNWTTSINPNSLTVGGGATRTLTVTIGIPTRTVSATAVLSGTRATTVITATSQFTPSFNGRLVDTTTVSHAPGLYLYSAAACVNPQPVTSTVNFVNVISNTGNADDSFVVNAASLLGWPVSVSPTTTAVTPPDWPTGVNVVLSVPPNPAVGQTSVLVTATSRLSSTLRSSVIDVVGFTSVATLTWSPAFSQVTVTDLNQVTVLYTHTLTYSSSQLPDNLISFGAARSPYVPTANWPAAQVIPAGPITMVDGQSISVTIKVTVPFDPNSSEPVNVTDYLVVSAYAAQGCEADSVLVQTDVRRPRLALYPDRNGSALPGAVITYAHTLSNTGGAVDTYDLTYTHNLSPAWNVMITPTTVYSLSPNSEAPITARVEVPAGALSSTLHVLTITATSRFNPVVSDTVRDQTSVPYAPGAVLGPDNVGHGSPGGTITYSHRLTNTGNYTETFSLTSQPEFGYPQVTPTTVGPLGPGEAYSDILVTITLPLHAAGNDSEHTQVIAVFSGKQAVAVNTTLIDSISGTRYVAPTGSDLHNNCATLEYGACATIQQAVSQAQTGDAILVAAGVYTGTLTVDKSLSLSGGYTSTNWLTQDFKSNTVTLDARGQGSAIRIDNGPVTISGLRITGGYADDGGAVHIDTAQPVTLTSVVVYSNTAILNGGGVYLQSGDVRLQDGLLFGNRAGNGGALYVNGTATLLNNTLSFNQANSGGAVYLSGGTLLVTNTIVSSNSTTVTGGAVYSANLAAAARLDYNDFWGNTPDDGNVPIGANSITGNPAFASPGAGDFHLTAFSAALNTGSTVALTTDFEGDARPQFGPFDIGADEFMPMWSWRFLPATGTQRTTAPFVHYSHILTNTGNYTDTASLAASIDMASWSVSVWPTPTVTLGPGLTTTILVTVTTDTGTPIGAIGTAIITATSTQSPGAFGKAVDLTYFQNQADLAISKSVAPTVGWLGSGYPFTYTLVYTNNGPSDGVGVVISDVLPIAMTGNLAFFHSGPAISATAGSPYVWIVSEESMPPGASGRITVTGIVTPVAGLTGPVTNTAQIRSSQNDPTSTNDIASAASWVDTYGPTLTGQPLVQPVNDSVTSTRSITFTWSGAAFSDSGGSGLNGFQLVLSSTNTYSTYNVPSTTTSLALVNLSYNAYTWTVRGVDRVGNLGSSPSPYTLTIDLPSLSVAKSGPAVAVAGAPFTYTITINNSGRMTATNTVLTDALPSGAGFLLAGPSGVKVGGVISWTNLTIPPVGAAQATLVVSACMPVTNAYYRVASSAQGVGSPMGGPAVATSITPASTSVSFTQSASLAPAGMPLVFTDTTTTTGQITQRSWNFGDGQIGSGGSVTHSYGISRTYVVTLTVTDACGLVSPPVTRTVAVTGTPSIAIWPPGLGVGLTPGETISFTMNVNSVGADMLHWSLSESATWLSALPTSGSTAGLSTANVVLSFVAPSTYGTYNTNVVFGSNDPNRPVVNMPISLLVAPHKLYIPAILRKQ